MTDPAPDRRFAVTIAATEQQVRRLLSDLRAWIADQDVAEQLCGSVEIVAAEALNNIVEHAYADGPPGAIQTRAQIRHGTLSLSFRDNGHPLPGLTTPDATLPDRDVALEDLPEGGFGWFLITELTSSLSYRHTDGSNHLEMTFDLTADNPPS